MNITILKIKMNEYKWLLFPLIPLLFFIGILIIFNTPQPSSNKLPSNSVYPTAIIPLISPSPTSDENIREGFNPDEQTTDLLNKETLPDGTIRYSYVSPLSNRPNITIADSANSVLFERIIAEPTFQLSLNDYSTKFGEPNRLFTGSRYYGPKTKTYIYADHGVAIIVDPDTQLILEYHRFPPMTPDNYIQKYGDDLINK